MKEGYKQTELGWIPNEWKELKHDKLTVKVTHTPAFCKLVSVYPNKVNFIIEK